MNEWFFEKNYDMKNIDYFLNNSTITGSWNVERGICDIEDAAQKLEKLYTHGNLRELYGKVGRKKVLEQYTWNKTIVKWNEVLSKLKNEY